MRMDCHNHSVFSMDGQYSVRQMCEAAAAKGIDIFALTDHCDINEWEEQKLESSIPASLAAIEAEKGVWPLLLLTGVELGQPLEDLEKTNRILADPRLDMVIGSIHNIPGEPDFYFTDYRNMTDDAIFDQFKRYYQTLAQTAEWGGFDTLAHITYPYRYLNQAREEREIPVYPEMFDADADEVFKRLIANQKALELNGSSLSRSEADRALNRRYFSRYRELGGDLVTFGSDAHAPEKIGQEMQAAYAMLSECGFTQLTYYQKRQPVSLPLPATV